MGHDINFKFPMAAQGCFRKNKTKIAYFNIADASARATGDLYIRNLAAPDFAFAFHILQNYNTHINLSARANIVKPYPHVQETSSAT